VPEVRLSHAGQGTGASQARGADAETRVPAPVKVAPKPAVVKPATPVQAKPATPVAVAPGPPVAAPVPAASPDVAAGPPPVSASDSLSDATFFNPHAGDTSGALIRTGQAKRRFSWLRLLLGLFALGLPAALSSWQ